MIITAGRQGEQLCWLEPWTRFSARTRSAALAAIAQVHATLAAAAAALAGDRPLEHKWYRASGQDL